MRINRVDASSAVARGTRARREKGGKAIEARISTPERRLTDARDANDVGLEPGARGAPKRHGNRGEEEVGKASAHAAWTSGAHPDAREDERQGRRHRGGG